MKNVSFWLLLFYPLDNLVVRWFVLGFLSIRDLQKGSMKTIIYANLAKIMNVNKDLCTNQIEVGVHFVILYEINWNNRA